MNFFWPFFSWPSRASISAISSSFCMRGPASPGRAMQGRARPMRCVLCAWAFGASDPVRCATDSRCAAGGSARRPVPSRSVSSSSSDRSAGMLFAFSRSKKLVGAKLRDQFGLDEDFIPTLARITTPPLRSTIWATSSLKPPPLGTKHRDLDMKSNSQSTWRWSNWPLTAAWCLRTVRPRASSQAVSSAT
eukprot:scaffold13094_cov70-Phaeocystis_antarctica.AAC.7